MAIYSRVVLSGAADGKGVVVAATAAGGTTIHTAHATAKDEVYLWVINTHTVAVDLTIEWGGTASPDNLFCVALPIPIKSALQCVVPGLTLTNSLVVKAYASVASKLVLGGHVNRIT